MEEKTSTTKIQLSLSAVMFFSPFVKNILHNKDYALDDNDTEFVQGYITLGYINIALLLLCIASGIGSYTYTWGFLGTLYTGLLIFLLILLVIESFFVLLEKPLLHSKHGFGYTNITANKTNILLSYLPLYNIFLWYHLHDFKNVYRWPKESILLWTLFIITGLAFQSPILGAILLIIIIARVASLFGGIDILPQSIKKYLNMLFTKNPEEIWGYITGTLRSVFTKENFSEALQEEQIHYEGLFTFQYTPLLVEYCLGGLLFLGAVYLGIVTDATFFYYFILLLIIGRYGLMYIKRWHVPHLPLCKEFTDLFYAIKHKLFPHTLLSRKS